MDRAQLIAEIKKEILIELNEQTKSLREKIPSERVDQVKTLKADLTQDITENPWLSVGIAALAGFTLARLIYKKG